MRFSESEAVAAAGTEALAARTSLNRANTISLMHEVRHAAGLRALNTHAVARAHSRDTHTHTHTRT